MDQAQSLRRLAAQARPRTTPSVPLRTMAVTSGKGGVGKTNLTVNLALACAAKGRKVLIIDADLGLANVDVVLGLNPAYNIRDVLAGRKSLSEVILKVPGGISILPAASGVSELSNLTQEEKLLLMQELDSYDTDADTIIVDTAAGISDTVLYFNLAVAERLVVASDEPTSLTDAYALMKVLFTQHQERSFKLLVNNVRGEAEAKAVYRKLSAVADHFLGGLSLEYLGYVPTDPLVSKSVIMQRPLLLAYPSSPAALAIHRLAKTLLSTPQQSDSGNIKFFWRRLMNMA
jgi:flagellar biosynthesis protein FlhG